MPSNRFYLACLRDTVGTNVSFHCKDGKGYSTNTKDAHVYTREEAQHAWEMGREFDLPLSADKVDALTIDHVDCQKLPSESHIVKGCTQYVGFQKGRWNGNDVYWITDCSLPTTDFSKAVIRSTPLGEEGIVWVPYELANKHRRPTFDESLIKKRSMTQAAGLKTPDHVKRALRRKESSKTRWNCPGCGKIHWQHNHCFFEGCRDVYCDEWRSQYA